MPAQTTYTDARAHLAEYMDSATSTREPVIIRRRNAEDVALIAVAELDSLLETAHLLRSPKNAERLMSALQRARQGEGTPRDVKELRRELQIDDG
jgi:antitoxin YefM